MKTPLLLIIILSLFLSHCTKEVPITDKPKIMVYTRYFKNKTISSRTRFKNIEISFDQEILGTKDEKNQSLKAIQNEGGKYYIVYYAFAGHILKYEYFEKGYLKSYATYSYGKDKTLLAGKLIRIDYFGENKNHIASDHISYDEYGKVTKTTRFIMPGRKLKNIF